MKKFSLKATLGISGLALLVVGVAVDSDVFNFSNLALRFSRALDYNITLNHGNAPTLSGGSGTMTDEHSVTWEYNNCASYASGHVTINKDGYFGISSSTGFGYTFVTSLVANFTTTNDGQLWLMTSLDGTNWVEMEQLTSGASTIIANDWRYVRFLDYGPAGNQINISSVSLDYKCQGGINASEDSDGAKVENVIQVSDNLTYATETNDLSPRGNSTQAVRFTKTSGNSSIIIGFGKTYKIGDIAYKKIEFDMQTTNINYGKTLQVMKDTSSVTSSIDSSKHSGYKVTPLEDNWYHIEVAMTNLISLISGYGHGKDVEQDIPAKNVETKEVNAIKINAGACVIDNLRITGEQCDLGLYNNGTSFSAGGVYWFKISWVGQLISCTITVDDDTVAEQVPPDDYEIRNGSPFYIKGLIAGTIVATATLHIATSTGEISKSISNTLTVN